MISSVMVEFKNEGSGVSSEIVYPENITKIIDYQYSNAAITAAFTTAIPSQQFGPLPVNPR